MFKNPFSFNGRIRRLEYGLSYIIFILCYYLGVELLLDSQDPGFFMFIIIIVLYWFIIAQGTKRCQDLGNNGFYQLIPLYGLWMLFEDGKTGNNKYGLNPKEESHAIIERKPIRFKVILPNNKTRLSTLNEIICLALLNTLLIVVFINYINNTNVILLLIILSIIPNYLLLLYLSNQGEKLPLLKPYLFRQRMAYSFLLYFFVILYQMLFNDFQNDENIFFSILVFIIFLGVTYIPFIIYSKYIKKQPIND